MMIKHLERKNINLYKWNETVEKFADGLPYCHSSYLDSVCEWEALVSEDYSLIFPLPVKKKKGICYSYMPFMIQQLGLIGSNDPQVLNQFIQAIPSKYKLVELSLNESNRTKEGFNNTLLDLSLNYEELYKNYSTNHKRNLKKVSDLELKNVDISEVFHLFQKDKGQELNIFNNEHLVLFKKLISDTPYNWDIKGVFNENQLIAGAVWVETSKRIIFLFSGNSQLGKEKRALMYLIDQKIKESAGRELFLDFEGSNLPNLLRFYKGFGSEVRTYGVLRKYKFPFNIIKK